MWPQPKELIMNILDSVVGTSLIFCAVVVFRAITIRRAYYKARGLSYNRQFDITSRFEGSCSFDYACLGALLVGIGFFCFSDSKEYPLFVVLEVLTLVVVLVNLLLITLASRYLEKYYRRKYGLPLAVLDYE